MTELSLQPVGALRGVIRGPVNAEKIVTVPDTPWVITSGMMSASVPYGRLYAVDTRDGACQEIYPHRVGSRHDAATYGAAPDALDPLVFEPHGLDVLRHEDGRYSLYVVNHGGRESVEVFDLDVSGVTPTLVWRGGVVLPRGTWPNDVAPLADGGFIVSNTADPDTEGLQAGMARMFDGAETIGAVEWHPGSGFTDVQGSRMPGANGIVASKDGRRVFIGGWRNKDVVRIIRDGGPGGAVQVDRVQLDILVDNLTWAPDGAILAAGAFDTTPTQIFTCFGTKDSCFFPCKVLRIDPDTFDVTEAVVYGTDTFGLGTTGLAVGDEIWVSSARAAGIARFASA
ncbi:hypothetical protein [Dactylosporangium salmoneum]|uniref:SMP-30/Gluconolactonase/LRE-like region domain-containing protein n=1 Tax=Dactylosporangium salmoneum TaxID=53361 RepID=A0ABN3FXP5_9ACTN